MYRIFGMVMAAGLVLGNASVADAQFALSVGDPYNGLGVQVGRPYGYGYGLGGVGTTYYGSGYSSYVAPGTTSFYTGTYAPVPYVYAPPVYAAPLPVFVPYRTYGYRTYRQGFGIPFVGRRRW